jgi:predicted nucleic acid-binding protein
LAGVIVLDASVLIAALLPEDVHHVAAAAFMHGMGVEDLLVNTVTLAEVLVSPPARTGWGRCWMS